MYKVVGRIVVLACVAAIEVAPARAESEQPPTSSSAENSPSSESLVDPATLTSQQKANVLNQLLQQQREVMQKIYLMAVKARDDKDMTQLNCARRLAGDVRRLLDTSNAAADRMYKALAAGQAQTANLELSKVLLAHRDTKKLSERSQTCVGETSVYAGITEVTVEVSRDVSAADPTQPTAPPVGPPNAPAVTSAF